MLEHQMLEVFSREECKKAAAKDSKNQAKAGTEYVAANEFSYYVLCNTWMLIWKNFSVHTWLRMREKIMQEGLIAAIKQCQDEASRIINGEELSPLGKLLYADFEKTHPVVDRALFDSAIGVDADATVLFLLRYPKRFSPLRNDRIKEESIKDFLAYENRTKMLQRSESFGYQFACEYVRDEISQMYDWDSICDAIERIDPVALPFTPGAAANARATVGSKLQAIANAGTHEEYFTDHFGVWMMARPATREIKPSTAIIQAVPKSYKASRIIAMDDVFNLAYSFAIEKIFRNADERQHHTNINLEDQSINQWLAQEGSSGAGLATLDASHASDLISRSLFIDVFPRRYTKLVMPLLPERIRIARDETRTLQMASTSGHSLTFRHETIVYKAIAAAAVRFTNNILGIEAIHPYDEMSWAYGDDTIVSSHAYDVALHFFARLGLKINDEKSYAEGRYRESCGKDYMDGLDVTSIYFPRFPVIGYFQGEKIKLGDTCYNDTYRGKLDNSLTMLIDLQKKIFPYSYDAARFVASCVKQAYPKMTHSSAGSVCTDLWDYADGGIRRPVPATFELEHIGKYRYPRNETNYRFKRSGTALEGAPDEIQRKFARYLALDSKHCCPNVTYKLPKGKEPTESERALFEYWKYTQFLKEGPRYDSELDRLLRISSKPATIAEFLGYRTLEIVIK